MADVIPLRQPAPTPEPPQGLGAQVLAGTGVDIGDDGSVNLKASDGTDVSIEADGSVSFPSPAVISPREDDKASFEHNLAEGMDDRDLGGLASDTLQGIQADEMSRSSLIANRNKGIELLGLKIEEPTQTRTQKRNVSKVGNPLLLGACIEYQSSFVGEMLPAAGPAKVQVIGAESSPEAILARDFESDFNYYLTTTAREYYPDTDRMSFYQGFDGSAYKKIYRCPMRQRPVSEAVYLPELIVSENASDIDNAIRVTHETHPSFAEVRRMQILGPWRDISLGQPQMPMNPSQRKEKEAQGLSPMSTRPQDTPYTIYETDAYIVPSDYGLPDSNAPSGLPLPFKITLAKDGQTILGIRRNWKEGDDAFLKRNMYVPYDLTRGMGFYGLGFLQLLGNQTRALRAIWRLLVDAGMFSNFPGGVKAKNARMSTNEIAPSPGEWPDVDMPSDADIRKMFMPMPYQPPNAVFIQLAQLIQGASESLAAKVKVDVTDGKTNIPVGSMMAMIEQQTQVMAAVHKRNHKAQADELHKLRELFIEHPKDLWRLARKPSRRWEVAAEFMDLDLVPRSNPNIPSQVHRVMQATALFTIATNPVVVQSGKMPLENVLPHIISAMNINDPTLIKSGPPPQAGPQMPPPQLISALQKAQTDKEKNQIAAAKLTNEVTQTQREAASEQVEAQQREADRQSEERIEAMRQDTEKMRATVDMAHAKDELAVDLHKHNTGLAAQLQQNTQRGFGGDGM